MPIIVNFPYGIWESTDAEHRWKVALTGSLMGWEERRGGAVHRTASTLVQVPGTTQWRAERANTRDVLLFLGAQPSVADEIVAANPPRSFLLVQLQGNSVSGSWNGLTWSLTPAQHLKEMHIAPAKSYTLGNTFQGVWDGRMWIGSRSFNISILIYFKDGRLQGQFLVPPDNQGPCDNLTISGLNVSFSVGAGDQQMMFSGSATAGFSNLTGTFQSHFGNGQWEVGWVKVADASAFMFMAHSGQLFADTSRFDPARLFLGA